MPYTLPDSVHQEIVSLYKSGIGCRLIGKKMGVSRGTVILIVRRFGLHVRNPKRPPTEETKVAIVNDYLDGVVIPKLMTKHRVCGKTIRRLLAQAGANKTMSESHQKYEINSAYFDDIDTAEKAYILGFLWADGCNYTAGSAIKLSLKDNDKYIIEKILKCMGSNHPIQIKTRGKGKGEGYKYALVSIGNQRLSQALLKLGMTSNKTIHSEWPPIPQELERHFIRGYFDGDGSWYVKKDSKEFCGSLDITSNKAFIATIAQKIKDHTGIVFRQYNLKHTQVCGRIAKSGRASMEAFGKWIYQDDSGLHLERKYEAYLKTVKYGPKNAYLHC